MANYIPTHDVELTEEQRAKLEALWFVYGNRRRKHTHGNHRFIQTLLEVGSYNEKFFKPTRECRDAVLAVLRKNDPAGESGD